MIDALASGVWRVGGSAWGLEDLAVLSTKADCNVYLLKLGGVALLVDVASKGGRSAIEANLQQCGVAPQDTSAILLTHSHFDHTHAAHDWQRLYHLPIYLNSIGAEYLQRRDYRLVGHQIAGPEYVFEPFRVDHALADGQRFNVGDCFIVAHHLPGHTPDSTLLVVEDGDRRIGCCGDITFAPRPGSQGEIGWLSLLWLSDLARYESSLSTLLEIRLDLLLPGHGHALVGEANIRRAVEMSLATVNRLRVNPDVSHFGVPV